MMLRAVALLLLILSATLTIAPHDAQTSYYLRTSPSLSQQMVRASTDPNATLRAFNYTLSQADLFTQQKAILTPSSPPNGNITFTWSSTVNKTSTGTPVTGTDFNFTVKPATTPSTQQVNWTISIPRSNCFNCLNGTIIRFIFSGNLTRATSASYTVTYKNGSIAIPTVIHQGPSIFPRNVFSLSGCPVNNVCIPVNKYVGYDLRLSFKFGWNATNQGLKLSFGELIVGAIGNVDTNSIANWMNINSTDTTKINHTAKLLVNLFNSTVQYPNATNTSQSLTHNWSNEIMNIYYPAGYGFTKAVVNSTNPTTLLPNGSRTAFERENCFDIGTCTQSLLAINMSDILPLGVGVLRNSTFILSMISNNSLHPANPSTNVSTTFGTIPLTYFVPGDNMTVKVVNKPSTVNMTAIQANPALTINFTDPTNSVRSIPAQSFSSTTGGLFGFALPQGPFGLWNATVYYTSNFDLGFSSTTFRLDQLVMIPQTVNPTISNNQLVVNGKIFYNSTMQPAGSVNGTLFAADASSGAIPVTATNTSTVGLYVSNATMLNGVFTIGQTLTVFFTVVNPTNPVQQFKANLTIQHEWASGQIHRVNATFPLQLGDQPFALGPSAYKMEITIGQNGIRAKVTSLQTQNFTPVMLSNNTTSPVIPTRQHTGMFKITVTSAFVNGTGLHSNSIETPPYAYVLAGPETSSGYLSHSNSFRTIPDGSFSALIPANSTIGAGKLVIFALARDANGIVLWSRNQDPTIATDNTRLVSTVDRIGELTVRQSATATLHVTNNSTRLAQTITIDLYLEKTGKVDSKTVTLSPGQSTTLQYHFQAPGTPGSYALTYSSAQYRVPLASQTIQVVLVQGIIQLLIPLIIGVIAAIAILGYYLVKKRPATTTTVTKPAPKTRIFRFSKCLTQTRTTNW